MSAASAFPSCVVSGSIVQSVATGTNIRCLLLQDCVQSRRFGVTFSKQVQSKENGAIKQADAEIARSYGSWYGNLLIKRSPVMAVSAQDEVISASLDLPVAAKVKFVLQKKCSFGQKFSVVGDNVLLGAWDPAAAFDLEWSEDDTWTGALDLPIGKTYEFKFLLIGEDGKVRWQPGPNRTFETVANESLIIVSETWHHEEAASIDDLEADVTEEKGISEENGGADSTVEMKAAEAPSEKETDEKALLLETGNGSGESALAVSEEIVKSND